MSQREILAIAIKVFSLWFLCWLFISVASFVPALVTIDQLDDKDIPTWAYIAVCGSFVLAGTLIAALLFRISNSVLSKLSSESNINVSNDNQKFILQVCGLFFIISSLIWLPSSFSYLLHSANTPGVSYAGYFFQAVGQSIKLIFGLWLVVHPRWWVFVLNKLRGRA